MAGAWPLHWRLLSSLCKTRPCEDTHEPHQCLQQNRRKRVATGTNNHLDTSQLLHRPASQAHSLPTELQTAPSTEVHPAPTAPQRGSWAPAIFGAPPCLGGYCYRGPCSASLIISCSSAYINTFFKQVLRGVHNLYLLLSPRELFGEER